LSIEETNLVINPLFEKAETYLRRLCLEIPSRRVGSDGNRAATDFFAGIVAAFGFETECPAFDCIDWTEGGNHLSVAGIRFEAHVSPYSLGCQVSAPLATISSVEKLELAQVAQKIVLVHGDLAKEQLMPINFPFYNPDHHKLIIQLLEEKAPKAIIAATTRNPEVAGAVYPFPLIEDGDFDIPSVYMTEEEGSRLAEQAGKEVSLEILANRIPAKGCNVIARKGADPYRRAVLFAHIDAKDGTPGAVDNATGVTVLLLLAELLAEYDGNIGIEIVALNGEDYYSSPGEQQYLISNAGRFPGIILGVNLDGVGYRRGKTAYSLYDCAEDLSGVVHKAFAAHTEMVEGDPWYQGDHSLFLTNGRPALAFTSERAYELLTEIVHTPQDSPEIVDPSRLVEVATALCELLNSLDKLMV
jgi:aminopeptidase YwaD